MLRSLHIRDFVIVDTAEIQFDHGFTVFSGETGAGKSILIDALSLALGARSDAGMIRESASRTDISAVFDTPETLNSWLIQHDLEADESLVLRRVVDAQGRSRAYINGVPVTLGQMRQLGEHLVDIHGQHAHQSLLKPTSQRELLDAQGDHLALVASVQRTWHDWQKAARKLEEAEQNKAVLQQERERLEWQVAELDRLELEPDEWQEINSRHLRLAHGQALLEGVTEALSALDQDEASAQTFLAAASRHLGKLVRHDDQLASILDAIESARIATVEAVSDLNRYLAELELDPDSLARTEQRLSAIFDTARKFKVEPEGLAELHAALQAELDASSNAADIPALTAAVDAARDAYDGFAAQLSLARQKTSKKLAAEVTKAMQTLAMHGGRFDVALTPSSATAHGNETVAFLMAGHEGVQPRPLAKVASGGELARLSLALSVIASQAARVPTLIFDEVDSGIGGAVAEVVGRLLKELGQRHQVLCVTHLPQVAACGTHHYRVQKSVEDNSTVSLIDALDQRGRIDEVARMLGGLTITDTTRRHAREMLAL